MSAHWIALALATVGPDASHWLVQAAAPTVAVTTLEGETVAAPWSTEPGVVVLWAAWCGPCVAELPVIAAALTASTAAVPVTLVSTDDAPAAARRALDRAVPDAPPWQSLWGGPKAAGAFAARTLPTAYVVGEGGRVHTVYTGHQTREIWDGLLGSRPGPEVGSTGTSAGPAVGPAGTPTAEPLEASPEARSDGR